MPSGSEDHNPHMQRDQMLGVPGFDPLSNAEWRQNLAVTGQDRVPYAKRPGYDPVATASFYQSRPQYAQSAAQQPPTPLIRRHRRARAAAR